MYRDGGFSYRRESKVMTMTLMRPTAKVGVMRTSPATYSIGDETLCVDWRWPDGKPEWRMSDKESVRWLDDGPLNEVGRHMLLAHFGLKTIAAHLPLEKIAHMSPAALLKKRRRLEANGGGLERLEPVSNWSGGHISASLAA